MTASLRQQARGKPCRRRRAGLAPRWRTLVLALSLWGAVPGAYAADRDGAVTLKVDDDRPTAGFFQLDWGSGNGQATRFELQQSRGKEFADALSLYRGADTARSMSGYEDGTYFFRVRAVDGQSPGDWSEPVEVEVRHHSLARALIFFTIGAVVFVATAVLIVGGGRAARRADS